MSELDTSALNVECCLYRTYVRLYIMAGTASSAGHLYRAKLLPPRVPIVLPHSISSIEQVCPKVRPCFWAKEPTHCNTYALLPCSRSSHNVLHSPSTCISWYMYSVYIGIMKLVHPQCLPCGYQGMLRTSKVLWKCVCQCLSCMRVARLSRNARRACL